MVAQTGCDGVVVARGCVGRRWGFRAGQHVRHNLALVDSLDALDDLIGTLDLDQEWPGEPAEGQRGRAGSPRNVALPEGWLESRELGEAAAAAVAQAELSVSGG